MLKREGQLVRTQDIHDHVFPLVAKSANGKERMAGTAFILGTRGFALTARHCLPRGDESLFGMFLVAEMRLDGSFVGQWALEPIADFEFHPTEDVAVLKLTTPAVPCAFLRLSAKRREHGDEYQSWGFLERGYDYINPPERGRPIPRPNLIYTKGYVRRPVSMSDQFRAQGTAFFEASEVAGAGCSGSPVVAYDLRDALFKTPKHAVIGVYIGEHTFGGALVHERDEKGALIFKDGVPQGETRVGGVTVGVVARAADFGSWSPKLLGRSLIAESNPTPEEAAAAGLPLSV